MYTIIYISVSYEELSTYLNSNFSWVVLINLNKKTKKYIISKSLAHK